MTSTEIKEYAYQNRVALWKIANKLGVCENTVARWLRQEDLPEDKQHQILNAIKEIVTDNMKL